MDIRDLNRDQLEQIKQSYYIKKTISGRRKLWGAFIY